MSNPKYSVVAVHGISDKNGDQQAGFSKELAQRVVPDPVQREKYWHEAVWEPVNDALDGKLQDVVLQLVNSYDKTTYWRDAELGKATNWIRKTWIWIWSIVRGFPSWRLSTQLTRALDLALDLPMYLGNPKGERIRRIVKEAIDKALETTPDGVVLVGHSLGSVIAYDVVRELEKEGRKNGKIKALVTMGSPLAWVTDLRIADGEIPDAPIKLAPVPWFNFYDVEDPVPLKKELPASRFADVVNEPAIRSGKRFIAAHTVYWTRDEVTKKVAALAGVA